MKISIAMATYNGGKYIGEQLESFANQTRQPDELIITDDGSTDETLSIIEDFSSKVKFDVKLYINEQNLGYAGNFNKALGLVTGDLIFLSDQDDVWFDEKIETIEMSANDDNHSLLFMNDAELTDEKLNKVGLTKLGQIYSAGLTDESFVMGCCCAIRRDLIRICLPIPAGHSSHDDWLGHFGIRMGVRNLNKKILQYYRRHGNNESDFVANRLQKISLWEMYRHALRMDKTVSLNTELNFKCLLIERAKNTLYVEEGYRTSLNKMLHLLEKEIKYMELRIHYRELKFYRRFIGCFQIWQRGGYNHYSGIKSLLRDLLKA